MDERTREILAEMAAGRIPRIMADDCEYAAELERLTVFLCQLRRFALALCQGDLSYKPELADGPIFGSLKALQANLRHLTWQTKQIAAGDFSQRVDFMGDFSDAFNTMVEHLGMARTELVHLSTHDTLTGLYNRAYFDTEFERFTRGRLFPISIIMADLNGLKQANDQEGHAVGDLMLKKAAELLREALRAADVVARIGGDEFAVILPETNTATALVVMERIRGCMVEQEKTGPQVSFAIGTATASDAGQMQLALQEADLHMYQDKAEYKKRIVEASASSRIP